MPRLPPHSLRHPSGACGGTDFFGGTLLPRSRITHSGSRVRLFAELKVLVNLHAMNEEEPLSDDEIRIIKSVLEMSNKVRRACLTPFSLPRQCCPHC